MVQRKRSVPFNLDLTYMITSKKSKSNMYNVIDITDYTNKLQNLDTILLITEQHSDISGAGEVT